MGRPATDKRQRLVTAAIRQFHRQGYTRTSLSDVAKAAGMSPGNVYYYFQVKEDLARAVIDEWCALLSGFLIDLEVRVDAWERLTGFLSQARAMHDVYVTLGCPLAGLARDLRQENDGLGIEVGRIYDTQFRWVAKEFRRGGESQKESVRHARHLLAGYHGSIHLAYIQGDATLIDDEVARLTRWLRDRRTAKNNG